MTTSAINQLTLGTGHVIHSAQTIMDLSPYTEGTVLFVYPPDYKSQITDHSLNLSR